MIRHLAVVVGLLLLSAVPAAAQEDHAWLMFAASERAADDGMAGFIDVNSIQRAGDEVIARVLFVPRRGSGRSDHWVGVERMNCVAKTMRLTRLIEFDGDDRQISSAAVPNEAREVRPGSTAEAALEIACETGDRPASDVFTEQAAAVTFARTAQANILDAPTAPAAITSRAEAVAAGAAYQQTAHAYAYVAGTTLTDLGHITSFVDLGPSVERSGEEMTLWVLYIYDEPRPLRGARIAYTVTKTTYDCARGRARTIVSQDFALGGRLLSSEVIEDEYSELRADTVGEAEMMMVCGGAYEDPPEHVFTGVEAAMAESRRLRQRGPDGNGGREL